MDEKTEKFLQELKDKGLYRDDYDYSKVKYINNLTDVTIIDENNFIHTQTPRSILGGSEFSLKSAINKNEYFIFKAKQIHGDKYDYSLVEYKKSNEKITIKCKIHDEFQQTPSSHLCGRGCQLCSGNIKSNNTEFIKKAKEIHGDKYDYSLVNYIGADKNIIINCKIHGEFEQLPLNHLKGTNCPLCSGNIKSNTDDFIKKAKEIHGDKYDYSLVNYEGTDKKLIIIDENKFQHLQSPYNHLNNRILSFLSVVDKDKYFIFKAKEIHGDKYDYSKVEYKNSTENVTIICKIHGEFTQIPSSHLQGRGCPICNNGWSTEYKLKILNDISNIDLSIMDSIELYEIITQGKLHKDFEKLIFSDACSEERISTIKELKEHFENNTTLIENIIESEIVEEANETLEDLNSLNNETKEQKEEEKRPPILSLIKDLHSLDNPLYSGIDVEAIEHLIQYKLRKLWNNVLNKNITITDIENEEGSIYFTKIKDIFIKEYYDVLSYVPPIGYNFKYQPNMMQKLTVNRLLKNKNYGNWSGTGAGKTLSFIIASREIQSKLTLVIALNSTVSEMSKVIKQVYSDNIVYTDYNKVMVIDRTKNNFIVLNYEKFQQSNSENLFQHLTNNNIVDFVVIDEVHNAKQRDENESERRKVLMNLLGRIRENNKDSYTLAMSATPVINNLYEAKSLLEMLTGKDYSDLGTRNTMRDAIGTFKQMSLNGIRFMPKYDISVHELSGSNLHNLSIDGTHLLDELVNIESNQPSTIEQLLLDDKLKATEQYLRKGTIIYSYYTTGIINKIEDFVKEKGFTVATYTGEESVEMRDENLKKFIDGKIDILVGSKPIGTGVDGLQNVCDRMICLVLPWTDAEYTQLKGRIYRQGSIFNEVEIIIPQVKVYFSDDKDPWSWDIQRMNLIKFKKTLADAAVDGKIPSKLLPSKESFTKKSIESLKNWKDRINDNNIISFERADIKLELYPDVENYEDRERRILSELSEFNQRGKITKSSTMHKEFTENKDSWFRYHKLRSARMDEWTEIPYEYIATKITDKTDVVIDFGCGENKFKNCIPNNKVISFDHVAFDDSVISCDMSDISQYVENESVDICVFSLSLWGTNFNDYIKEAYRVLRKRGIIYIAEPSKYYQTDEELSDFTKILSDNNFKQFGEIDKRSKFVYITGIKM